MTLLAMAPTTLPETAPLEFIAAAAEAGYDAVGLRLNRSPGLPFSPVVGDAPLIREIKRALADTGLSVLDIFSFYLEPVIDLDMFRAAMEIGSELGGRYALVMGDDPDWSRQRENFARVAEMAAGFGLVPALEPAVTRPLASHRLSELLIAESGRSDAVICLDPLNLMRAGETAADIASMNPRLFPFAQIGDGFLDAGGFDPAKLGKMSPNRRAMIGDGDLPVTAILDALPAGIPLSVETPVAIGIAEGRGVPSAAEWAKRTLSNAREFLDGYRRDGAN